MDLAPIRDLFEIVENVLHARWCVISFVAESGEQNVSGSSHFGEMNAFRLLVLYNVVIRPVVEIGRASL